MNERIKELAIEANMIAPEPNGFDPTGLTKSQQKFAELLLDEFIEALEESNGTHSETSEYGLSILIGDIRKHFGEE